MKERKKEKHLLANNTYNKKKTQKHLVYGQLGSDLSTSRIRHDDAAQVLWILNIKNKYYVCSYLYVFIRKYIS
jgi:hypothetical protein